jgi:hypothetical protein
MFCGRLDDARVLYLQYRGEKNVQGALLRLLTPLLVPLRRSTDVGCSFRRKPDIKQTSQKGRV